MGLIVLNPLQGMSQYGFWGAPHQDLHRVQGNHDIKTCAGQMNMRGQVILLAQFNPVGLQESINGRHMPSWHCIANLAIPAD